MYIQELWDEYARRLGKSPDALTDSEKRQAFLDAILEGKRIEPFATIADAIAAEREACAKVADKWEQHASKTADRMGQCIVQSYVRHEASAYRRIAAAIRARGEEEE